jgi:hypothetical protein
MREYAGYAAKPPAAFDARLHAAALGHARDLVAGVRQGHAGQLDRVTSSGFRWRSFRGNILLAASDPGNAHAAFAIDWGRDRPDDGDGMQAGRGHRKALLSLDGAYSNVGIAAVPVEDANAADGPLVITEDFCSADTSAPDHFNRFIVGTVWNDKDGDGSYEDGEGIGGVTVMPDAGPYYALTGASGGYAIPVAAGTTTRVVFSGPVGAMRVVSVGEESVLVDLEVPAARSR